jgi:REP element-mobilizing transposase RayT
VSQRDWLHFLKLLAEQTERFGTGIHAYVLMDNHFHLMLETPEANLSRAMQWLGVSYSIWFNRRHDRAGHLFQGNSSRHRRGQRGLAGTGALSPSQSRPDGS